MSEQKQIKPKDKQPKKRTNRRLLSFYRVCRYGMENFFRNSWLSVAATAVMVITLLIIFSSFIIQSVSSSTVDQLRDKVDISIYLKPETDQATADNVIAELKKLDSVKSVSYVSSADAREQIAQENSSNSAVLEAIKEATNKTPATVKVVVKDINDTSELEKAVTENTVIKDNLSPDYKPSFAGDRRQSIKSIGSAVGFAQKAAIGASILFVVISSLIIFNTIQMAIFNRKDEIQMMKLIGAGKGFIRGPFLIESVFYGIIAAVIASGLGMFILYQVKGVLSSYFYVDPTIDFVTTYAVLITLVMMVIGSIIGIISSYLATRRYLKL